MRFVRYRHNKGPKCWHLILQIWINIFTRQPTYHQPPQCMHKYNSLLERKQHVCEVGGEGGVQFAAQCAQRLSSVLVRKSSSSDPGLSSVCFLFLASPLICVHEEDRHSPFCFFNLSKLQGTPCSFCILINYAWGCFNVCEKKRRVAKHFKLSEHIRIPSSVFCNLFPPRRW